ncbi:MAG: hypothetical protein N2439_17175 [Anaerolineae bacterium]|nr:hypothetical protein [Anaerolineae bacterium]
MFQLTLWQTILLGIGLALAALLMAIWWRQQTYRWPIIVAFSLVAALLLSWYSGLAFRVEDYRAGCDGLCPGYAGAPVPFWRGAAAGGDWVPGFFVVNTLAYVVILLGWGMFMRAVMHALCPDGRGVGWRRFLLGVALVVIPTAFSPRVLPPPEAHVRGDSQRIAINARREVYMYSHQASAPVLQAGLEDVRPRRDGQPGMRVCLRIYTFFYVPIGHMYLDMTAEGVHSNAGGVRALDESCWQ